MFDTMTLTKIAGGVLGAWLVLLLGKFGAEALYHADTHGEASYVIEVASAEDSGDAEPEEEVDFEAILASADPAAGERVFRKCSACHKVDGTDGVGPHLNGVVGREVGGAEGYASYSGALSEVADVWSPENLNGFLERPASYAPGTTMGFAGLSSVEERANVIAYLESTAN